MRELLLEYGPKLRRAILLGLTAGVPLIFLRFTADPFGVPKLGLLMMGLSLVLGLRLLEILQGASRKGLDRIAFPALTFMIPLLISWLITPYKGWSLFGWYPRFLGLIPYALVILYGVLIGDAFARRTTEIAWTFAITGTTVGAYGLLQVVGADPFAWNTAGGGSSFAISTFGNSNFVGTYLAMCLPFFPALWMLAPERRDRLLWMAGTVAAGCVVTLSEAAWASAFAGLLVIGGFLFSNRWRLAPMAGLVLSGTIAASLGAIVLYRAVVPGTGSITYRGYWWRAAADMAAQSPLWGRGPASFALEGIQYRPSLDAILFGYGFPDDPHAVFLSLLTAAGALGVIGFLTLLVWIVRTGYVAAKDRIITAAFLASAIVYFVNSVTTIDDLALRVTLWSAIGGLAASVFSGETPLDSKRRARRSSQRGRPRWDLVAPPAVVLIVAASLAVLMWSALFVAADANLRHGKQLFLEDRVEEARSQFRSAIGFRSDYVYRQVYGLYLGLEAVEDPASGDELIAEMHQSFSYLDDVPYIPAMSDYANRLFAWGEFDEAAYEESLEVFRNARRLDPLNPLLAVDMAEVLVELDRPEDAIRLLESYRAEVEGLLSEFHAALGLAYFHAGELESARAELEQALSINASDATAVKLQGLLDPPA